ncbi:zinc ribbon domain-containing protein [Sporolactobacillus vineae]|uniref:zinc ribbon domain-containing protein n=1 Tax=Sporolactobacillus vineae TaxID=444463 RepID=UPI0002895573|nr:zinc ribbon domain-containing protein [Sporolactobacillus vineae]
MHCPNCGHEIEKGAHFCTSCGAKLDHEASAASAAGAREEQAAGRDVSVANEQRTGEGIGIISDYWEFIVATLKQPFSQGIKATNGIFGYVSIVLAALLLSAGIYQWLNHLMALFPDFVSAKLPFDFIHLFLFVLVDCFLIAVLTYLVVKWIYRNSIPFNQFLTKYAGQGTPVLVLTAVTFLIGLAGLQSTLPVFIMALTIGLLFLPSTTTLFAVENHGRLDRIYAYLITYVATALIQALLFRIAMQPVIDSLHSLINSLSDYGF